MAWCCLVWSLTCDWWVFDCGRYCICCYYRCRLLDYELVVSLFIVCIGGLDRFVFCLVLLISLETDSFWL